MYPAKVITTLQNETVVCGATLKINGEFNEARDGWITKLSARGTVLWSKRYYMGGFNSGGFSTIELATDSTYFVSGRFGLYKKNFNGSVDELNAASFIMHLDKFGNLLWLKRVDAYISNIRLGNIVRVSSSSYIITGSLFTAGHDNLVVLNIDFSGNVRWYKLLYAENILLFSPVAKKLKNGEVILAGGTVTTDPNSNAATNQGYYCLRINPAFGEIISSKAFYFNTTPTNEYYPFDNIRSVMELDNDTMVLGTSFSERERFTAFPGVKECVLIKTGLNGSFYSATAYFNSTRAGTQLIDVAKNNDDTYSLLIDDGFETLRATVSGNGQLITQQGYGLVNGNLRGLKLLDRQPENRLLFGGRTQVPLLGLMKTEPGGNMSCMETGSAIISKNVTSFFTTGTISLATADINPGIGFEDFAGGIGRFTYPFTQQTDCYQSCCENLQSDTTVTEICNALRYELPDNTTVKESGIYYIQYTTASNCDSTAFFDIRFSRKPVANLGPDVCMNDSTQYLLKADSGYYDYNWMGTSTGQHTYLVTEPGKYTVTITNSCGVSTDEIEVFKECEFPVFIPTAFTPNNDGLNDLFRYPSQNKNRFISLSIYNRWGQKIFYTTNPLFGWDGKYKSVKQPADIYVCLFELETLNNKKILKKGTFQLIR